MTDLTEAMEKMAKSAKVLGGLPGLDPETVSEKGANRMRRTIAENLAKVTDEATEVEIRDALKDAEDEIIESNDYDTKDMNEGQVRMMCHIALVESVMEDIE